MKQNRMTKAVIYARVSSPRQVREGHGLQSQETRCREYARIKGYEIAAVFSDDISGKTSKRPGMADMLAFVSKTKTDPHAVIIDDINRLARDIDAHRALRKKIRKAGGVLVSPSFDFGDTSDDELIENVLASVAQHHRQKNAEQVVNRMTARMMNGYYVLKPPPGFKYEKQRGHGKILVPDEPVANAMRQAFEGFASGRLHAQIEMKRFLENHPDYPSPTGHVSATTVRSMLENPLYAGCIQYESWGVSLRDGQHEGLISYKLWLKVQDRLKGRSYAATKAHLGKDFALRGFVTCEGCEKPMSSCYSKGRSKHYAYYLCHNKGCDYYGKSVRREDVESAFEQFLKQLRPSPTLLKLVTAMFKDAWHLRSGHVKDMGASMKKQIEALERKIGQLVERVIETDSQSLILAYEGKIKNL